MEPDTITLPYSVAAVLKDQQKLIKATPRRKYVGRQLSDADIKTLAIYLQWKTNRMDVPLSFFLSSLDVFRYRTIDESTFQQFLRRMVSVLAMNEEHPHPVTPWTTQEQDEWVPVEVMHVTQKEQALYIFRCRALCSRMVEQEFDYRVSMKMAYRMAGMVGFNQRSELKRLLDPRQFVGLRLVLQIAKNSAPGNVKVLDCGEHSATTVYNQRINKQRDPEFRKCPHQKRTMCFQCGIGKDKCRLAIMEETNAGR
jgi:hypothetical protein